MSPYGSAARSVAHSGPPRWDATLSQMGFGGSCEWVGAHRSPSDLVFPQPARRHRRIARWPLCRTMKPLSSVRPVRRPPRSSR